MNKKNFCKSDWFPGLTVSDITFIAGDTDLSQSLERKVHDVGVATTTHRPGKKTTVIAMGKPSQADTGIGERP